MSRHTLNEAEQGFLGALLDDGGQIKTAVKVDPGVFDALGIPAVSAISLEQLEAQAGEKAPATEEPAQVAPEGEAGEVEAFERTDEEPPPEPEPAPEPELPSRLTHGKLFTDKRAHPLQLLEVLTVRYKAEWTEWESDTLWWSLRRSFGPVGEVVRNKIMALRLAATTDVPWIDWDVFEDCGLSWNDIVPTMGAIQPMTPMQAAFSVQILKGIRPDDELGHEIKAYIAAILDDHGWAGPRRSWNEIANTWLA